MTGDETGARRRDALVVALSFASGAVDAVGFLALGGVFLANMTGNFVLLGLAAGQGRGVETLGHAVAFAGFVGGQLAGFRLVRQPADETTIWPARVRYLLGLELLLLVAALSGWIVTRGEPAGDWRFLFVAVLAAAMDMQNAGVHRLSAGLATGYITGALTALMGQFMLPAHRDGRAVSRIAVILALGIGAAAAALLLTYARPIALVLPVVTVLAVVTAVSGPPRR
ncbi:YoaK family protein [Actinopolymorpha alba]|uniref:YoaK family protein n=1 Tax=Actinopolymorpha alba TaxID=533267 RepID=UPI00037611B9|nr:YoaK family protein [Actinopolymorpha alba]